LSEDRPQRKPLRESLGGAREKLGGVGRGRLLAIIGIVVVVLVVFVAIPGYVASQPKFMDRYANMKNAHETLATSVHAQAKCQDCHVAPKWIPQAVYSGRMLGEFYLSFVFRSRQPKLLATPTNAACSKCHVDLRTVSPSGDLNIPHRAHVAVLKMQCVECHKNLVHTTNAAGNHTPAMTTCLTCHDGKKAKNNCSACHTEKALPENHKAADWIVVHPDKQKEVDCAKCHKWTEKWCAECHKTRPRSHTKTWRSEHGDRVKARRNCEACHDAAFCVKCHGEVPTKNFNPALKVVQ
jgi:hypothetical protein